MARAPRGGLQIGGLRHRVTFERQGGTGGRDSLGGVIDDWSTLAVRWGDLAPVSGREKFDADQHRGEITHRLWVRYGSDIADLSSADRFTFDSRIFDIEVVKNPRERNRFFEIQAVERDT